MRICVSACIAFLLITSCGQNDKREIANNLFSADTLAKDISVLASDEFLGRKPFTEGETKTINYLKERFASIGIEPGNGNSYFQEVPMVDIATKPDSLMQVQSQLKQIFLLNN